MKYMTTKNLPFIHLLKTPMNNYAFDVNTNAFIELSDETYAYLSEMLDSNNPDLPAVESVKDSIKRLKSLGYLSDKRPNKIEHWATSLMEYSLNENIKQMTLQITQECNFRCAYCSFGSDDFTAQREHTAKRMSLETALKAVDFLLAHSKDQNVVSIGFYGGEPLLEFDMIKTIIEYAEKVLFGKDLLFTVTTNASLLTVDMAKYFYEHNCYVVISLDGTPEIHNRSRKFTASGGGTFGTIKNNLNVIKEEFPAWFSKMSFNVVIDPSFPCNDLYVLFSEDETFTSSVSNATIFDDFFSVEKVVYSDEFTNEHSYHSFKAYLALLGKYPKEKVSKITWNYSANRYHWYEKNFMLSKLPDTTAPGGPCIPGEKRLFVSVDGLFYPCERVSETSDAMIIGNLQDGFYLEKAIDALNIGSLTEADCKNCWAINHCTICVKHCDNNGELCAELKRSQCGGIRQLAEDKFREYLLLKDYGIQIDTLKKEGILAR